MSIAPIIQTVTVTASPARAFDLFARQIGHWWPKDMSLSKPRHDGIFIEPKVDGRWYERDEDGAEIQWGKVLAWEPPGRLLLAWQLNGQFVYDPDLVTEVELTFVPNPGGGSVVKLEHRHLERLGVDAEKVASSLRGGWTPRVAEFAAYANLHA